MRKCLGVTIAVIFVFLAVVSAHAKSVTLEFKYKKGEVTKYKLAIDQKTSMGQANGPGMAMKMTANVTEKVLAVNKDGSIKIQVTLSNIKMSMPGMQQGGAPKIPDQKTVMTISKTGKIIYRDNNGGSAGGLGMPGMGLDTLMSKVSYFDLILPGKAVSVGETWKRSVPVPEMGVNVDVVSKLEAAAIKLGKETVSKAKQTFKSKVDIAKMMQAASKGASAEEKKEMVQMKGSMDIAGTTVFHFSPGKGKLWKSTTTLKTVTNMTFPASMQKQGAPPKMSTTSNVTMTITKVN